MITTINEFKLTLNESNTNKYKVVDAFIKPNYKIILNRSNKFLNYVSFKIDDVISYTVQSGSLGDIVEITNHTTNKIAKYWSNDYGLDKKTKNSIEVIQDEPDQSYTSPDQSYTAENNINKLWDHQICWSLYELFSEYVMTYIENISRGGYEILLEDNSLVFNAFDEEEKSTKSKIVWTTTLDITGIDRTFDSLYNFVKLKLEQEELKLK